MRHQIFEEAPSYEIALLIKSSSFQTKSLENSYVKPLHQ